MSQAIFFRLLDTAVDEKHNDLAKIIATLNDVQSEGEQAQSFRTATSNFSQIPGSPFAYWVSSSLLQQFAQHPPFESNGRVARLGDHPDEQDRYVHIFWEVSPNPEDGNRQWVPYQKGGVYSPYYADIHLVVDWDFERETYFGFYGRPGRSSEHPSNYQYFHRPGLTWPRRTTSGLSVRALPAKCVFADKGPAALVPDDDENELISLLAVMNSSLFKALLKVHLGAADAAARSYEVGRVQQTPVPNDLTSINAEAVLQAHDLTRDSDRSDETTHLFGLPGLVMHRDTSLLEASQRLEAAAQARQSRLAAIQASLDETVFDLYGLNEADRQHIHAEMGHFSLTDNRSPITDPPPPDDDNDAPTPPEDLPVRVQNLLMWCVGVAYGRWDARFATQPELLPALQGPFDPLPRCAPGALLGTDGLPATLDNIADPAWLAARTTVLDVPTAAAINGQPATLTQTDYPLPIAWDGILVDDPTHPADIVGRVRAVLTLVYGDRASAIEQEACEILGVSNLRDYFRDPRRFFAFHIRRYSKSRRKAPIYWLLQSANRSYAVWLYLHRLGEFSYLEASRNYVDAKINLERDHLQELRQGVDGLLGAARKQRERQIGQQQKLVDEVVNFGKTLDAIGVSRLPPDLNDGVLISIAPLHQLVPWKEAARMWQELVAGRYTWSTMSQQMARRNLIQA